MFYVLFLGNGFRKIWGQGHEEAGTAVERGEALMSRLHTSEIETLCGCHFGPALSQPHSLPLARLKGGPFEPHQCAAPHRMEPI